jgi:hypothetical protein
MPTTPVITFNGGTASQQASITTAMSNAETAISGALAAAVSGGGAFTTWFGAASTQSITFVSRMLTKMLAPLQSSSVTFEWDLVDTTAALFNENIVALISDTSSSSGAKTITFQLWVDYWDYAAVWPSQAATDLLLSIIHQLACYTSKRKITDVYGVIDEETAQLLATFPFGALTSAQSYMYFAQAYT